MKRDSGYSRSPGGDTDRDAENRAHGSGRHERQCPGGDFDDTPGQAESNVSATVLLAQPKRIDSMGGSESRGKDNYKRGE